MKKLILAICFVSVSGCATVKQYWPKAHDTQMFSDLVSLDISVESVDCDAPTWSNALQTSQHLARYAAWRSDPQAENLAGLHKHIEKLNAGGSRAFCELGKKTAKMRIHAAKTAWSGR
jgi:hypothetical protein